MSTAVYTPDEYPHSSLIADTLHKQGIALPTDYNGTSQDPHLALAFNAALRLGTVEILTHQTYDTDLTDLQRIIQRYNWVENEASWGFESLASYGNLMQDMLTDTAWWHYLCAIELTYKHNPKAEGKYVGNGVMNLIIMGQRVLPMQDRLFDLNKLDALHLLHAHLWTHLTNLTDDSFFNDTVIAFAALFDAAEIEHLTTRFQPFEIGIIGRTKRAFGTTNLADTLNLLSNSNLVLLRDMLPYDWALDRHRTAKYPDEYYLPGIPHGLSQLTVEN